MPRLLLCFHCGAMVDAPTIHDVKPCACGGERFLHPSVAPWKLSPGDLRFLRPLRIATEDETSQYKRRPA